MKRRKKEANKGYRKKNRDNNKQKEIVGNIIMYEIGKRQ